MAFDVADVADVALSIKDKCATTCSKEYTQNTKQHTQREKKKSKGLEKIKFL